MTRAVLLDIDGVLTVSWQALPGAAEALDWLRSEGHPVLLVTNTSARARRTSAATLTEAGLPVAPDEVLTAVGAARTYLMTHHPGAACFVVNEGSLAEDLEGIELVGPDRAGVVLLGGAGPSVGYPDLNAVFRLAIAGVPVVALHHNTRFQTADGPALDMGAFIPGLEEAARITVPIIGKPAPPLFEAALSALGSDAGHSMMVGDDLAADVVGAQAVGITGVLVRTGKFRPDDLTGDGPRPDHVIDTIADLPDLLRDGRDGKGT